MCPVNGKLQLHDGRTAYHFQPAKFWQNDPNGPLYHNGLYHFFYQYNPHGPLWDTGKLSWGHSVSGDLVNWAFLGTAIDPTDPFDVNGCWSGSATVLLGGRPAFLYTGRDAGGVQVQNVSFAKNPLDPLLREWEKPSCNPIIAFPADVINNNFRDPTTAWLGRDGLWRMVVAAEVAGAGSALVYRSADFLRWERNAAPMHSSAAVPVLECPDFFPVAEHGIDGLDTSANGGGTGVKHVLKLSEFDTHQDFYMVGRYDDEGTPSRRRSLTAATTAGDGAASTTARRTPPSRSSTRAGIGVCSGCGSTSTTARPTTSPRAGPASRRSRGRCGWTATGSSCCSGPSTRSRR
ncbi:Os04g0664900 [Oryza sativa Japonica Group]|uniref:beta-fructofuranosidase n=1 Tax=Oryza sativa subsp. japonica TaxID=39947 RepID=A0A0N7KJV8_ORYSJ|nr:Os04g0664900 [Oryza sativa Japonica Group]